MARRSARVDRPDDIPAVIRALRACRDAIIKVIRQVKINGAVYVMASALIKAIDALADELTGTRNYFHLPKGGATDSERAELDRRSAWERGE